MAGIASESRAIDLAFLRYIGASAVALGADFGAFLALLRLSAPAMASATLSYSLGIVVHWLVTSRAVFGDTVAPAGLRRARQKALFIATGLLGLALTGAIAGAAAMITADPRAAKLVAVAASFITTWTLRRRLVFAGGTGIVERAR